MELNNISTKQITPYNYLLSSDTGNSYIFELEYSPFNDVIKSYVNGSFNIYEIYFDSVFTRNKRYSPFMYNEIRNIITNVLEEGDNKILYFHTYRADGRNYQLFQLYNRWFQNFVNESKLDYIKVNKAVVFQGKVESYFAFLMERNSLDSDNVENITHQILAELYPHSQIENFV